LGKDDLAVERAHAAWLAVADTCDFFAVANKKMRFAQPPPKRKAEGERADITVIHYNDRITLSGMPEEAHRYILGSRSAIE
jgi:predicted helicase